MRPTTYQFIFTEFFILHSALCILSPFPNPSALGPKAGHGKKPFSVLFRFNVLY